MTPNADDDDEIRPIIDIVVNGHKIRSLVDTGASATLIDWTTFLKIRKNDGESIRLQQDDSRLRTASGQPLEVRGMAHLCYQFGKRTVWRPTLVVSGLKTGSIIGADTLRDEGMIVDVKRKKIICSLEAGRERQITTSKKTTLSAKTEVTIACVAAGFQSGQEVLVEENLPSSLSLCLETAAAIHRLDNDDRLHLVLSNISDSEVHVPKGTCLATGLRASRYQQLPIEAAVVSQDSRKLPNEKTEDVDLSKIPIQWRAKYLALIRRFSDIFSTHPDDIGHCTAIKQQIKLKDPNKVSCVPPYRLPVHLRHVAEEKIEKLLRAGVIRKSTSPFCSPLLLVRKPGAAKDATLASSWRAVNDYRMLNSNTVRDAYPMHHVHDLLDRISQNKIWSVIDMTSGFFNQALDEASRPLTAFAVPGIGHYEYNRSAQGLTNSPAAFQRLLDYVTRGLKDTYVYVDDLIVASPTHEEHLEALADVFTRF
jgi:hypothetical protein